MFRICARGLIRLIPVSERSRGAIEALRTEIRGSQIEPGGGAWSEHQLALRKNVLTMDPRSFLTWDVIADTIAPPPYARFVWTELGFLRAHDWRKWSLVVGGNCLAAANRIHQAYHLCRFETETAKTVHDFEFILEFGGGYGELRRIVGKLGFPGCYVIFDLPAQIALQRYYLAEPGGAPTTLVSDLESVRAAIGEAPVHARKLFIATWSFDETPLRVREPWLELLNRFDGFLIAYQANFAGVDNCAFFDDWRRGFLRIWWSNHSIPQLKDSFYLFGVG